MFRGKHIVSTYKPREGKPRKDELVTNWQDWFTEWSMIATFCGIEEKSYRSYLREPKSYNDYRAASKWVLTHLEPALLAVRRKLSEKPTKEWEALWHLDPNAQDLITLNDLKNKAKSQWTKRPNF